MRRDAFPTLFVVCKMPGKKTSIATVQRTIQNISLQISLPITSAQVKQQEHLAYICGIHSELHFSFQYTK